MDLSNTERRNIMAEETQKYYWLKLKRDFFKRHDIRIIEEMPNGKDYVLFYLKLLLESVDHEGTLRFSDTIPYNEQMLSVVTNTNIDIVRAAMKLFIELKMIDVFDDQTIYMNETQKLIGSECKSADRVRKHREKQKMLHCNTDVTKCNTELELQLNKEINKDIDITTTTTGEAPTRTDVYLYFKEFTENAVSEAEKFHTYNSNKGWTCLPNWEAAADLWIARIDR
jgi:predicted phage replisome organizer